MKHLAEIGIVGVFAAAIACAAAWATHIVWTVEILMGHAAPTVSQIALGVTGVFMPPVGAIHGFIIWFS